MDEITSRIRRANEVCTVISTIREKQAKNKELSHISDLSLLYMEKDNLLSQLSKISPDFPGTSEVLKRLREV